jgi:poly(3-hydroxybutyrate) depolymerase
MGSNVRQLTSLRRRGGKAAAVIAGAAVAMLCTGTAFAANMTSTPEPAAALRLMNAASRHDPSKPRTGGGRDAVLLGPARRVVAAGQLVPGRVALDPVSVA